MLHKRCDIRDLIDNNIRLWRTQRDNAEAIGDDDTFVMAVHYIEAFQEIRLGIFDDVLSNDH